MSKETVHHNHTTRGVLRGWCPACDALSEAQNLQDAIDAAEGVTVTRAEDDLAKSAATLVLGTLGYTGKQIEKMWEDDAEGRKTFRKFAKEHAIRIRAEAKATRKTRQGRK